MKVTMTEAKQVFGIKGDFDQDDLRRRLEVGQQKMIAAYFVLADSIDAPEQVELPEPTDFLRVFVAAMHTPAPKRSAMDAFVQSLCTHIEARGVTIDRQGFWGNTPDSPPKDTQLPLLSNVIQELPGDVPEEVMDALRLFRDKMEVSTRATVSLLIDALKAIKRAKSWVK
jgi:hypothetical protein